MNNEKFCLRWNDFEGNISSAFRELRDDKDFFDVTLACENEQIQAHKVILSACSPFFRSVLRRNPHQHPLLFLKGVKYKELQSVLSFMYQGEVNVAQDDLNSFLSVAEDLKVKGLTQNTESTGKSAEAPSNQASKETPHYSGKTTVPRVLDGRNHPVHNYDPPDKRKSVDNEIQEVVPIKSEPRENTTPLVPHHVPVPAPAPAFNQPTTVQENSLTHYQQEVEEEGVYDDEYGQYEDQYGLGDQDINTEASQAYQVGKGSSMTYEDLNQYIGHNPGQRDYFCTLCPNFHSKRPSTRVRDHLEAIHFPGQFIYACTFCDKTFNGKNLLAVHKSTKHPRKKSTLA